MVSSANAREGVGGARVGKGCPLPVLVPPPGSVPVSYGVDMVGSVETGGAVFFWGMAASSWIAGDVTAFRAAAVHVVRVEAAPPRKVAAAFGVNESTLLRWRTLFDQRGIDGLVPNKRGPKGPSKVDDSVKAQVRALWAQGIAGDEIARRLNVSARSVFRVLKGADQPKSGRDLPRVDPVPQPGPGLGGGAGQSDPGIDTGDPSDPSQGHLDLDLTSGADLDIDSDDLTSGADLDIDSEDLTSGEDHDIDSEDLTSGADDDIVSDVLTSGEVVSGVAGGLVPLARPVGRGVERQAARAGALSGATPIICEGAGLPLAGAWVILPALEATGLLEVVARIYATGRAAFYSVESLVLSLVFAALLGEPRVEGFTRLNPTDMGRLLGLDRAPEPKTVRTRIDELAGHGQSAQLIEELARVHLASVEDTPGVFYVDGHVRAYHGTARIPKRHVARIRLAMPAEEDIWVADQTGAGLLVWQTDPGSSLVGELARATEALRAMVGPDTRPTIAFDRGGWSPALFATLTDNDHRFDILTYRKAPFTPEPISRFEQHHYTDPSGRTHTYLLADRPIRLPWKDHQRRNRIFPCRQITRLDPDTGHQTQIVTSRTDPDPAPLAHAMFSRWRQENYFRYMRSHYALDALDAYHTTLDDPTRLVANPARKTADRAYHHARKQLDAALATEGHTSLTGGHTNPATTAALADAYSQARTEIAELDETRKAIPAKVALGDLHPDHARLDPERKRIHDAIRIATYNAETTLARLITPHYRRASQEARSLLREIFHTAADIHTTTTEIHVTIHPLSAPRRTHALTQICDTLNTTNTPYPGTNLTLRYHTHPHQ